MMLRRPALLLALLIACATAGCGSDKGPSDDRPADDKSAVEATMKSYLNALANKDGEQACSHLTASAQRQIVDRLSKLDAASGSTSCEETLGNIAESTAASTVGQVCGADDNDECERVARKAAQDLIRDLKDVEIKVQVSGNAATAGPAAGPEGFDGQLQKIDGEWLISKFASI